MKHRRVAQRANGSRPTPPAPTTMAAVFHRRFYGYRSWDRRTRYLIHVQSSQEGLTFEKLRMYKNKNLKRVLDYLIRVQDFQFSLPGISPDSVDLLLCSLREYLLCPEQRSPRAPRVKNPLVLRVEWNESMLHSIPVKKLVVNGPDFPLDKSILANMIIAKKLTPTLGDSVCNYRAAARSFEDYSPPGPQCPCRRLFASSFRPNNECVFTMNPDIATNIELRILLKEGAGYRERFRTDILVALREGLDSLIHRLSNLYIIDPITFRSWRESILSSIQPLIRNPDRELTALSKPIVKSDLRRLQRYLVITITDKAPKNFAFICKNVYKHTLHQELQNDSGAYSSSQLTNAQIIHKFRSELITPGAIIPKRVLSNLSQVREDSLKLPLLYWLPKMHKDPPKARFIAGSAQVLTTPLALAINSMLGHVKSELIAKDHRHIIKTGVKRCWFVDNHAKVCRWLSQLPRPSNPHHRSVNTFDFSTMYTTLDLNDLVASVDFAIQEAFVDHQYLRFDGRHCEWIDEDLDRSERRRDQDYEATHITHLVRVLVNNTFIQNGDFLKLQTTGLPMGTNPAPHLADLCCFAKEARFMDHLQNTNLPLARRFIGTFRLIDDILSCDNPSFHHYVLLQSDTQAKPLTIYPSFLELNQTNDHSNQCTYLGMSIMSINQKFLLKLAPTDKKFPYPKINYPSLLGNFPKVLGHGVFTGQLYRYASICSEPTDFLKTATTTSALLLTKGYTLPNLFRLFRSFVNTTSYPYRSIALPLMTKAFYQLLIAA